MPRGVKKGSKRGPYVSKNKTYEENIEIRLNQLQRKFAKNKTITSKLADLEKYGTDTAQITLSNMYEDWDTMTTAEQVDLTIDEILSEWSPEQTKMIQEWLQDHGMGRISKNKIRYQTFEELGVSDMINDIAYDEIVAEKTTEGIVDESIYVRNKDGELVKDKKGRPKLNSYLMKDWYSTYVFGS